MPSTRKEAMANARKKVTALARPRINTGQAKWTSDHNGSHIQDTTKKTVSNVPSLASTGSDSGPALQKKVCHYHNEGNCSHEGNHGQFRHNCAFCAKQGRNNTHSETKCLFKQKGQDKNVNK